VERPYKTTEMIKKMRKRDETKEKCRKHKRIEKTVARK
jgi:hypothetical protein